MLIEQVFFRGQDSRDNKFCYSVTWVISSSSCYVVNTCLCPIYFAYGHHQQIGWPISDNLTFVRVQNWRLLLCGLVNRCQRISIMPLKQKCHFHEIFATGCTKSRQMTTSAVASDDIFIKMIFLFPWPLCYTCMKTASLVIASPSVKSYYPSRHNTQWWRRCYIKTTSFWRNFVKMMSFWRYNAVIITSGVQWVIATIYMV